MSDNYIQKVNAVVFDWAGTTVDYGCFAPLAAFIQSFEQHGTIVTEDEVRGPMGMKKKDHIRVLLQLEGVQQQWLEKFGRLPDERDVDKLYASFESMLMQVLPAYTSLIPGVQELMGELRSRGIKIGSTTGYTSEMMSVLTRAAEEQGYKPDYMIASDEVPAGRPAPYMCYQNAIALQVFPLTACVKIGDTISDIQEGLNAGMWSVGVVFGGSEFGLTEQQMSALNEEERQARMSAVRTKFAQAGAHYTIDSIGGLLEVIDHINQRLAHGEMPSMRSVTTGASCNG